MTPKKQLTKQVFENIIITTRTKAKAVKAAGFIVLFSLHNIYKAGKEIIIWQSIVKKILSE